MGACTKAALATPPPQPLTRRPLAEPRYRHRPSPAGAAAALTTRHHDAPQPAAPHASSARGRRQRRQHRPRQRHHYEFQCFITRTQSFVIGVASSILAESARYAAPSSPPHSKRQRFRTSPMARLRQRRMWSRRTSRGGLYIEPAVSSFESSANRPSSSLYRAQCETRPIGLSAHVHQMAVGEQLTEPWDSASGGASYLSQGRPTPHSA